MNIIASNRPFSGCVASNPKELQAYLINNKVNRIYFPFWSWKVPDELLNKYECIGFHSAPLPFGKGGTPIQNMIRLGYDTTVVCMFHMEKGFDDGEILCSREVSLDGTLAEIVNKISKDIEDMINGYENNCIVSYSSSTYYGGVPLKFQRIMDNHLMEVDTTEKIYDEIRMRDEVGHPKTFLWHGKHRIDFSDARMEGNKVIARVEIYEH